MLRGRYTLEASFCGCDDRRSRHAVPVDDRDDDEAVSTDGGDKATGGTPAGAPSSADIVGRGFHFSTAHLQQIGIRFCRALHAYFGLGSPPQSDSARQASEDAAALAQVDGLNQLPQNQYVRSALLELMSGDFDAGDGDSEGSDGG